MTRAPFGSEPARARGGSPRRAAGRARRRAAVGAQSRRRDCRVPGVLSFFATPDAAVADPTETSFRQGLREVGYVEGENIVVERRYADGRPDRLAAMAAELVRLKVDVILAGGQPSREAARKATTTIPIVTLSRQRSGARRLGARASRGRAATSPA